ncbi:hypothetical protein CF326_g1488 [Tilletia indica]|uniref:Uncharacterized protein n=1 Tax=Tilletia indica TaxID=43049 RepID=A0A177TLF1_9BASI|nr:hypothetical protein CF326_g1488 [Tilletia indica]KAE8255554.1 hypothetical protein A4X13_0g2993 [Tilletia indica]
MATNTSSRAWSMPPLSGFAAQGSAGENTLHGAYMNSGRLSEGLARLHSTSALFKQTAARNDKITSGSTETVARVLSATQEDIKQYLLSVQSKFEHECDDLRIRLDKEINMAHTAMKARMETELKFANMAIARKMDWTLSTVDATLRNASTSAHEGVMEAIDGLSICGTHLQRDINNTENDYMRSLAQNVMGTTWSAILPEAIRVVQHTSMENHNLPPTYVPNGEREGGEVRPEGARDVSPVTHGTDGVAP